MFNEIMEKLEHTETGENVSLSPPGRGEGRQVVRDLRPVEGEEGHGEASLRAEELVDDLVLGRNPCNCKSVNTSELSSKQGHIPQGKYDMAVKR